MALSALAMYNKRERKLVITSKCIYQQVVIAAHIYYVYVSVGHQQTYKGHGNRMSLHTKTAFIFVWVFTVYIDMLEFGIKCGSNRKGPMMGRIRRVYGYLKLAAAIPYFICCGRRVIYGV